MCENFRRSISAMASPVKQEKRNIHRASSASPVVHFQRHEFGYIALLQEANLPFLLFIGGIFKRIVANDPFADRPIHQSAEPTKVPIDRLRCKPFLLEIETEHSSNKSPVTASMSISFCPCFLSNREASCPNRCDFDRCLQTLTYPRMP